MKRNYHTNGSMPRGGAVFVFGSNLAGRHGKGAALVARQRFGALYGQARGRQGQSYAIPTKDGRPGTPPLRDPRSTRPLADIAADVARFLAYARQHPDTTFFVTRIGCDLATHQDKDMAPLFRDAPGNCSFPQEWGPFLAGENGVDGPCDVTGGVDPVEYVC